jgi:methylated-DNA-protein-cysteine methyltransferase-like protein
MNEFYKAIFEIVKLIPKGRVTSYGAIANALGKGGAARQVGYAMHQSPEDVPAHRVLNRNGDLSGKLHFGGNRMQELLEGEGHVIKEDQLQNFKKVFWDPSVEL